MTEQLKANPLYVFATEVIHGAYRPEELKNAAMRAIRHHSAQPAQAGQVPITSETGNTPDQGASAITSESGKAGQVLTDDEIGQIRWQCRWSRMSTEDPDMYATTAQVDAFARAIEQAVMAKRVPQWLPIETAPKDFVSEFDGWNGERVPNVSWAHPEYSPKGHFDWCVSEYETGHGWVNVAVKNLTHWMPLPPPPGIVGGKGVAT